MGASRSLCTSAPRSDEARSDQTSFALEAVVLGSFAALRTHPHEEAESQVGRNSRVR